MLHSKKFYIISSLALILIISLIFYFQRQPMNNRTNQLQEKSVNSKHNYKQENVQDTTNVTEKDITNTNDENNTLNEPIIQFDSEQFDLDNDGVEENIILKPEGDALILTINNKDIIIDDDFNFDFNFRFFLIPKLNICKQKDNKNLVLISHYDSAIEMWSYDYSNDTLKQNITAESKEVAYEVDKIKNNIFKINFPDLNYKQEISIPKNIVYSSYYDLPLKGYVEFSGVRNFKFSDINKNGYEEIVTQKRINTKEETWLYYSLNTYYELIDGDLKPIKYELVDKSKRFPRNDKNTNFKMDFDFIQFDLNNDRIDENIKLRQENNTLILTVNDNDIIINEEFDYLSSLIKIPKLEIWKQKNNKNLVLIPLIWDTTSIGSSIEMWLYDYNNNEIQRVFDFDCQEVSYEMIHMHDNKYKLNFLELNYSPIIEIDEQLIKYIDNEYIKLNGFVWFTRHICYGFFDYDNDGTDELVTRRQIHYGALDWLPDMYTIYECNDNFIVKAYDIYFDYKKVWPYY